MFARTVIDLGLIIRERRRKLGLDQRSLAERVGVSRQWIVGVEKGKTGAEVGLVLRTLAALDLELSIEEANRSLPGRSGDVPPIDIDAIIDRARAGQ